MKSTFFTHLLLLAVPTALVACDYPAVTTAPVTAPSTIERGADLDAYIEDLMAREHVVGLAVSVVEGGEIIDRRSDTCHDWGR